MPSDIISSRRAREERRQQDATTHADGLATLVALLAGAALVLGASVVGQGPAEADARVLPLADATEAVPVRAVATEPALGPSVIDASPTASPSESDLQLQAYAPHGG